MLSLFSLLALSQISHAQPDTSRLNVPGTTEHQRWYMSPVPTRAGFLRFVGSEIANPEWTQFYLKRLIESNESLDVKVALIDLIARSGGNWHKPLVAHFKIAEEPSIRRAIIDVSKRIQTEDNYQLIRDAAVDPSPIVRASAMRAIGYCPEVDFSTELALGLSDNDAEVLQFAARTVGWNKSKNLFGSLEVLLNHQNGDVRYQSINAIQKIDPERARNLSRLLVNDTDSRVDRIARKLLR